MEEKLSLLSLSCPSLTHISPTQLLEILTRWGNKYDQYLNPIWLNNNGKAVVGIFPKTAFYLLAPLSISSQNKNAAQLRMLTLKRKSLKKILKLTEDNRVSINLTNNQSVTSFIKKLSDYSATQIKSVLPSSAEEFSHGFLGFVGYDVVSHNILNNLSTQNFAEQKVAAYFGHYPIYLTCEERSGLFFWNINLTDKKLHKKVKSVYNWLTSLVRTSSPLISMPQQFQLIPRWSKKDYNEAFRSVQEYLRAGDCYQINLTQEWTAFLPKNERLVNYLSKLFVHTKAPFSGYLNLQNFELLSCSPELFFTFKRKTDDSEDIVIYTKPIKGTRPRGKTIEEDQNLMDELSKSEKDLAENVMIVDLLRNDLGKYAKTGTVKVPKRFEIETFSNVHHMVSTITAVIRSDVSSLEVLFGSLPAGSITGTPKERSVEIINELEGSPRGAYCGTMGFMNFDGTGQWNVLIRTIQANDSQVSLWAGGGITVSSDCDAEYKECFDKIGNIIEILANK